MTEEYTKEEKDRLWQLRLNNDTMFNNRLNFFLVSESILIAIVGNLANSANPNTLALILLILLGFIFTVLWYNIQSKQRYLLRIAKDKCRSCMPEYDNYKSDSERKSWTFSVTGILAKGIPSLIGAIWIALFIFVVTN